MLLVASTRLLLIRLSLIENNNKLPLQKNMAEGVGAAAVASN